MSSIWNAITDFFASSLDVLQGVFAFTGDHSWGWAIIALTLITRVLMLPLNVKQTKSMRAMQELAPKQKRIQQKYKVDRELMRSNPEKYRMLKQKQNEEMMALYSEAGVNPAGGCLPLLAQMPIFIALFSVLRSKDNLELLSAPFYFFTSQAADIQIESAEGVTRTVMGGLGSATNSAGVAGWLLIVLMAATMFVTQRQMMARNTMGDDAQQQQQKIMLYVMPPFLAFVSLTLPLGVLLYWVTTNLWQMVQQWLMFRHLAPPDSGNGGSSGKSADKGGGPGDKTSTKDGSSSRQRDGKRDGGSGKGGKRPDARPGANGKAKQPAPAKAGNKRKGGHLPDPRK